MTPAELLDLEARYPRHTTVKDEAIRAAGLKPARFYQLLARAAASREGQAADPITAHRVLRNAA